MFGGDPMKRSLSNQITTQMLIVSLPNRLGAATLYLISLLCGHLPYWLGVISTLSSVGTYSFLALGLIELVLLHNFNLYKFSISSGINDDFFSRFLLMTNLFLAYGTQIAR